MENSAESHLNLPRIHHGEVIRRQILRGRFSLSELARQLGISRMTLSRWLDEASWETGALERAGELLGFNPFAVYCEDL